ncbi:MAG: ABC transporter related protein [Atribacteria bacterium 34_868]|nr:MAG: ABC transporter related protein [Atribacteria bacterium 34_868]
MEDKATVSEFSNRDIDIIMRTENVTKVFPGIIALDGVNYNIYRGKINVLVGENGAGKSTLMKILAGNEQCTKGRIILEGEEIHINSPQDAMNYGISIIYQELDLCPNMSIAENIFLGREIVKRGIIENKIQQEHAYKLIHHLEQEMDPNTLVSELRIGAQQIVTIAKALSQDARILVMDEPTSALSTTEVEVLFRVIYELKERGITIIYISHKLDEVLHIGDNITVLRDGHIVAEEVVKNVNIEWVIEKMIGRKLERLFASKRHKIGKVLLQVEDLSLPRVGGGYIVNHVSFNLQEGEILGIYGLKGAGRSEMLECLMGANMLATGKIWLGDKEISNGTILDRIQAGLALVPEDRQRDGLVLTLSVADNMILASLEKYLNRFGLFLVSKKEKNAVHSFIKELSIKVSDPKSIVISLSGGNQQKVVLAKGLLTSPKVLMLDEPTRGIDVGAKHEVFEIMQNLAAQGYGILFVSSELKEILAMSDRILVMSKGKITGEFTKEMATEARLINASVNDK